MPLVRIREHTSKCPVPVMVTLMLRFRWGLPSFLTVKSLPNPLSMQTPLKWAPNWEATVQCVEWKMKLGHLCWIEQVPVSRRNSICKEMLGLLEVSCVNVQASNVTQGSLNGSLLTSYFLLENPGIFVICGSKRLKSWKRDNIWLWEKESPF